MTVYRIDISKKSGAVMLWIEDRYGLKPVMGWDSLEGVKEFAEMLLDFYHHRTEEKGKIKTISDELLRQALGDEG
jgi:hypothetical protein